MATNDEPYDHRQSGGWVIAIIFSAAAISVALGIIVGDGDQPARLVGTGTAVLLLVIAYLFNGLRVRVTGDSVIASFGSGLIARHIPLREIAQANAVTNRWWYGWGIRLVPHGWMFNIRGLDAVELMLRSGKCFRIGTDEPHALVEAIRAKLGNDPSR